VPVVKYFFSSLSLLLLVVSSSNNFWNLSSRKFIWSCNLIDSLGRLYCLGSMSASRAALSIQSSNVGHSMISVLFLLAWCNILRL